MYHLDISLLIYRHNTHIHIYIFYFVFYKIKTGIEFFDSLVDRSFQILSFERCL